METLKTDHLPHPEGELTLRVQAMPRDTNPDNDIFGGWVVSQMDLAAEMSARQVAHGRVATVAIDKLVFMRPIEVGDVVSFYTIVSSTGRSSIQVQVEAWTRNPVADEEHKVTEGNFVFVAIDVNRRTRKIS